MKPELITFAQLINEQLGYSRNSLGKCIAQILGCIEKELFPNQLRARRELKRLRELIARQETLLQEMALANVLELTRRRKAGAHSKTAH